MSPDQYTIKEKHLDVSDGHKLYIQLWGNEKAEETILFLHGGPGSGCSDSHKTLFNGSKHKVIFFDQRGCGKSLPYGSLKANDVDALVSDINVILDNLGTESVTITGGSWGSTLGLVYAINNPSKVNKMVLRGIFTGRKSEIDFLDKGIFRSFYPDVWQEYVLSAPKEYREDPSAYHHPRILGEDKDASKLSAYSYSKLELSLVKLDDRTEMEDYEAFDPVPSIIECHYLVNKCFLSDEFIMKNTEKLSMQVDLIQGRYDMICPPFTAYELSTKLKNCRLFWTNAGHSGRDRANWDLTKALLN